MFVYIMVFHMLGWNCSQESQLIKGTEHMLIFIYLQFYAAFFYPDLVAFSFNLPYEMEALTLIDEFKLT